MNCDVCGRHYHAQRLPFLCAVDARNQLYEPRLAHVAALLHNEELARQVDEVARQQPDTESTRQDVLDRTRDVQARAARLREKLAADHQDLVQRRDVLRRRRADLAAATHGTAARRARLLDEAERATAMTRFKWNRSYDAMAATRGFLCLEAARLYGLRRVGGGGTHAAAARFLLGGCEIVDPLHMASAPPEHVSTSLGHVAHLVMLACHYLAVQLPAELTLPHRDYPRPTIFSLASSYAHGDVPFPGTANFQPAGTGSSATGASAGRDHEPFQRVPRARPLYLDKPLAVLAKDDRLAHNMFLDGVALLAYDIAWLCGAQGVPLGDRTDRTAAPSLDDVLSIGRNLYNLLVGSQLLHNPAGRIVPGVAAAAAGHAAASAPRLPPDGNAMGRYAHGTAHTFLDDDVTQSLKIPMPKRLADRLRARLSSEAVLPDWELLSHDAWAADDHGNMEDGVQRDSTRPPDRRLFGVESVVSMASVSTVLTDGDETASSASAGTALAQRARAGTSGWTKLRNRSGK